MKKTLVFFLLFALLLPLFVLGTAGAETPFDLACASAVLMEASTGKIIYEKNADEALPPASVTKVMTLLLTMEAVTSGKIGWSDTSFPI